jgi:hypothetical protein
MFALISFQIQLLTVVLCMFSGQEKWLRVILPLFACSHVDPPRGLTSSRNFPKGQPQASTVRIYVSEQ